MVALTVDDGYFSRNEMLDVLIEAGVHATFFIIGRVLVSDADFVRRAVSENFEFGSHTNSHGDLRTKSRSQIVDEVDRPNQILLSIDPSAVAKPYLRPPGGSWNSGSNQTVADLGYRHILWNVSGDAGDYSPEGLINLYLRQIDALRDPRGSIILTHFRKPTLAALPAIISGLRERGLEPVSLSELFVG